jgi:hypothetical protein
MSEKQEENLQDSETDAPTADGNSNCRIFESECQDSVAGSVLPKRSNRLTE